MSADLKRLRRDPWFVIGSALTLLLALLLLLAPWLTAHDPHDMSFAPLTAPSAAHWLGVNDGGMDIWAELLAGLGNTIVFGLIASLTGLLLAVVIGLTSAWVRGVVDALLMRTADLLLAIPSVMILILLAAFFQPAPVYLALILALLAWPMGAKVIRSQALTLQGRGHLLAARQMGAGSPYIIGRHLLPELFPLYLVSLAALLRMAVFMEATLSFLGLFDPGRKSLGMMIRQALSFYHLDVWWHWLLPPILLLCLLMMASTFLLVSLEKFFDPRLKGVW